MIHDKYIKKYKENSIVYPYIMELYDEIKNKNIIKEFLSEISHISDFEEYNMIHNRYAEKYRDNRIVHDYIMKIYAKIKNGDGDESEDDSFLKETEKIIDGGGQKSPLKKEIKDYAEEIASKFEGDLSISEGDIDSIIKQIDNSDSKFNFNHSKESKKRCDECKGKIKDRNLRSKIETSDGLKTVNFCSVDCFEKSDWEE